MLNQLKRYIELINGQQYVVVGSGSGAEKILSAIKAHNLPLPTHIFDDRNEGKAVAGLRVEPLNEVVLNKSHVLIASTEFKANIRRKITLSAKPLSCAALDDFAKELPIPTSSHAHPIIINTIPKCGNVFMIEYIKKSLGLTHTHLCAGPWPEMVVSSKSLSKLSAAATFSIDHIPTSEYNIASLKTNGIEKIMVHGRDPRQATLSWTHWIDKKEKNGTLSYWERPQSANYFSWSLEDKLHYQIEHWLPTLVSFLDGWKSAKIAGELEVLVTDFTQMKEQPEQFFDQIGRFFNMPLNGLTYAKNADLSEKTHYRKGLTNEWESTFTSAQIDMASSLINPSLASMFGWKV